MGFSRQEYWRGLSYPPPGDLPEPGIKPVSLTSHALAGGFFTINTNAIVLYIVYFSYSLYLYSLQCDFAAFAIKVGSGESVSLPFESGMALQLALVNRMFLLSFLIAANYDGHKH